MSRIFLYVKIFLCCFCSFVLVMQKPGFGKNLCRLYDDEKLNPERPLPIFKVPSSKFPKLGGFKVVFPETGTAHEPWIDWILDPGSGLVLQWNRIFLFSCLVALFVDPLFFYLPSMAVNGSGAGSSPSCMTTDLNLGIVVTCFRTVADVFYLLQLVVKFRTAYVSPAFRAFGRGELVTDPKRIAMRYLRSGFFLDLLAALPLPQV